MFSVDDAWGRCHKGCSSPVAAEFRDGAHFPNSLHREQRRITRRYEAARRNGHYTQSPEQLDTDNAVVEAPGKLRNKK
jgi:hypothetical protein